MKSKNDALQIKEKQIMVWTDVDAMHRIQSFDIYIYIVELFHAETFLGSRKTTRSTTGEATYAR